MHVVLYTQSPEETEAAGCRLGERLRPGDVVALVGPLGAGKTVFARGIAAGCGARGYIASPSFVIVRQYAGRLPVYHADLFRLDRPEDVAYLGLDEMADGILVVEWAERAAGALPAETVRVSFAFGVGTDERRLELWAPPGLADRLEGVAAHVRATGTDAASGPGRS